MFSSLNESCTDQGFKKQRTADLTTDNLMTIIFLLLKNGSSFWVPPLEKIFTTSCISLSKHSVIHLLTTSLCFSCEQNNIVNVILQHSGAWVRGVKPRKSCFAVSASLHASLNVQPVIHHLANKQRNQFKLKKKIQQLLTLCKGRMLKGAGTKLGPGRLFHT